MPNLDNRKANAKVTIAAMAMFGVVVCGTVAIGQSGRTQPDEKQVSGYRYLLLDSRVIESTENAKPTDGISIVPTLLGRGEQKQHDYLYWELRAARAVRMGNWKAVKAKAGLQLFDLRDDPSESTDVAAGHPDVVKRIRVILEKAHTDSPFATWTYKGPMPTGQPKPQKKRKSRKP